MLVSDVDQPVLFGMDDVLKNMQVMLGAATEASVVMSISVVTYAVSRKKSRTDMSGQMFDPSIPLGFTWALEAIKSKL